MAAANAEHNFLLRCRAGEPVSNIIASHRPGNRSEVDQHGNGTVRLSPNAHHCKAEIAAGITVALAGIARLRTDAEDVAHHPAICSKLDDFNVAARPLLTEIRSACTADIQRRVEALPVIKSGIEVETLVARMESWIDAYRYHITTGEHVLAMGDLTRIRAIADVLTEDAWRSCMAEAELSDTEVAHG